LRVGDSRYPHQTQASWRVGSGTLRSSLYWRPRTCAVTLCAESIGELWSMRKQPERPNSAVTSRWGRFGLLESNGYRGLTFITFATDSADISLTQKFVFPLDGYSDRIRLFQSQLSSSFRVFGAKDDCHAVPCLGFSRRPPRPHFPS